LLAAGAGFGEEKSIEQLWNKFSFGYLLGAVGSAAVMYGALHNLNTLLEGGSKIDILTKIYNIGPGFLGNFLGHFAEFITSLKGFFAVQGLILLLSFLFRKKPSPEQVAAETLNAEVDPEVWNPNGQVIFLTAGLTMAALGNNLSPTAPAWQLMTLTQAAAITTLTAQGPSQTVPTNSDLYADVFVKQGPTTIVEWVTPRGTNAKGQTLVTLTAETLKPGLHFAATQPDKFLPFFLADRNGNNPVPAANLL